MKPIEKAVARLTVLVLCLFPVVCTTATGADRTVEIVNAAAASDAIIAHPLRDGVVELEGSGGNITALDGSDGKFLVDSGIALSKDKIKAALNRLSPAPVKYVVNTHWHWDHADGNAWLRKEGATIIATRNTLKYLSAPSRVEEWEHTFPAAVQAGLPTEILSTRKVYQLNGETVVVTPLVPGHTNGDLFVYFRKANVLSTGDVFWNDHYPFIDNGHGGGVDGTIAAIKQFLALIDDQTLIVPGHGSIGNKAGLRDYLFMLTDVRENIAALKAQGLSLTAVIAANPTATYDAKWGTFIITRERFITVVYKGL